MSDDTTSDRELTPDELAQREADKIDAAMDLQDQHDFRTWSTPYRIGIADCAGENPAYLFPTFEGMLAKAKELYARIDTRNQVLTFSNQNRADADWRYNDGLTEEEREALCDLHPSKAGPAVSPDGDKGEAASRSADSPERSAVGAHITDDGQLERSDMRSSRARDDARSGVQSSRPGHASSRRLTPHLKAIDGYIRALESIRPQLQNPDREVWSVLDDLKKQAIGLVTAINTAKAKEA